MTPLIAEFIATFLLLILGNGVVANVLLPKTKGYDSGWLVITTGWGLAVFTGVVVAGPYSGAHLNPAVTLGLAAAGEFPWAEVPGYISAQILGAFLGGTSIWLMYKDHYDEIHDSSIILATFSTIPAIRSSFNNLISEIMGTFVLVFVVFYISDGQLMNLSLIHI